MHTACTLSGLILLFCGILDFSVGDVFSLHLSHLHNSIHVFAGLSALLVGQLFPYGIVKRFAAVMGSFFLLLGSLALVLPESVASLLGHKSMIDGAHLMPDTLYHLLLASLFFVPIVARYLSPFSLMTIGVRRDGRSSADRTLVRRSRSTDSRSRTLVYPTLRQTLQMARGPRSRSAAY